MEETSHLEKLGTELKCPICLSLLESAMSLTCNHVFCNSCIHKSMKSGPNCPVCKVPYQRREIRPAPHMDNLVNIYKRMEVDSGLSFFVTQHQSSDKVPDAEKQTDEHLRSGREETSGESPLIKCQRKKRESSIKSKLKRKLSGHSRGNSSFQMNKRVQVPQSPMTETPLRPVKNGGGENKLINNVMSKSSESPIEHQLSNGNKSPRHSPFFWLREDDLEKSSQQMDMDHLTCTPVKAPSFSDLKDSDDDVPSSKSPKEQCSNCSNIELLESELFEWTQRPCSPELCSGPFEIQAGEAVENDKILEKEIDSPTNDTFTDRGLTINQLTSVSLQEKNGCRDEPQNSSCPRSGSGDSQTGAKIPQKQHRKASKESQNKGQVKNVDKVEEDHDGQKIANEFKQGLGCNSQFSVGSLKLEGTSKRMSERSVDSKLLEEVEGQTISKLPISPGSERGTNEEKIMKKGKRTRNFKSIEEGNGVDSLKRKKRNQTKTDSIQEVAVSQDTRCGDTMPKSYFSTEISIGRPYCVSERSMSRKNKKCCQQEKMPNGNVDVHMKAGAKAEAKNVHRVSSNDILGHSLKEGKDHPQTDRPTLRKCNIKSIECAFCHSTAETEASGEMVHYSEGKPVSATYSGGSIIHSHKSCSEWAPNVYFEDDIAVNLEEELARSRRIKCALCGVKGAALGCYDKSCRKSFHVPCAKRLRECRWDTDHFVILCPVHASSKLPHELSPSQVSRVKKGRCNTNGKFLHQPQVSVKPDTNTNGWIHGQTPEKILLCCSALASDEKETILEFVKSSGVSLLESWNPSATHVIASTNANGSCKRTLKVLLGILEGKWILSIKWVQACLKAMRLVEELPYEISCDIYGVENGPRLGRLRYLNMHPKLFSGFKFYLTADFESKYKAYLQDLVTAAGGTILHRKPIAENLELSSCYSSPSQTVIVYSIEKPHKCDLDNKDVILDRRRSDAEALASSSGARVANNTWVLNCIAGHKLQDL